MPIQACTQHSQALATNRPSHTMPQTVTVRLGLPSKEARNDIQPDIGWRGGGSSVATHSVTCQENGHAVFYVWDDDTSNWALTTCARTRDYVLVKSEIKTPSDNPSWYTYPEVYDSNGNIILDGHSDAISLGQDVEHARIGDKVIAMYLAYRMPDEDTFVKNPII